jgi:hypothetical protein
MNRGPSRPVRFAYGMTPVLGGGTLLTLNLCKREGKPHVVIDASKNSESAVADAITRFVEKHGIHVLNVAGPRLSGWRHGHGFAVGTLIDSIQCVVRLRIVAWGQ